ncbi:hypothetical protein HPB49_010309 [Dermacentor silvarum]|uniref:Uncharacterized protein n=1 Tax=Dermacentor silvarum TaxID=543639 RepID=A0ACB8DZZ8_DERSI|nr:hypothetical protein HPB49_010309 [Dermacentor silvarum]
MNKIETLASNGSSANTRPQNNTTAANNAGGLRKVPRRDRPSPRLGRTAGEAGATQRAPNNQEAMDADESPASGEEAATSETVTTATTQIPREGELTDILAAIAQINERLGKMDARLEAFENQLNTPAVKHKRLALKVASTSLRNRFMSLKRERAERVKDAITKRRNRLETSGKDDAEPNSGNLFVSSAYCRPSQQQYEFDRIISQAKRLAGTRPLLILGDFIAPHTTWGCKFQSKRGKALTKAMEDHVMALLNEPDVTTRRGNSAARDTTPDLSWLSGTLDVSWRCEDVDLGSDHSVISITIRGSRYRAVLGTARITDWAR